MEIVSIVPVAQHLTGQRGEEEGFGHAFSSVLGGSRERKRGERDKKEIEARSALYTTRFLDTGERRGEGWCCFFPLFRAFFV